MADFETDWKMWLGKRVCVKNSMYGTLQYFGSTCFSSGLWCGIALDCPLGKNNGTVNNVRYFKCKPKFGIFVQPCKVTKISETKLEKAEHKTNTKSSTSQLQNACENNINLGRNSTESACDGLFNHSFEIAKRNFSNSKFDSEESLGILHPDLLAKIDSNSYDDLILDKEIYSPLKNNLSNYDNMTDSHLNTSNVFSEVISPPQYSSTPKNLVKAFTEFNSRKCISSNSEFSEQNSFASQNENDAERFDNETLENISNLPSMTNAVEFRAINDRKSILTEDLINSDIDNTFRNTNLTITEYNLNETFTFVETTSDTSSLNESKSSINVDQKNLNRTINLDEIVKVNENPKNLLQENFSETSNNNSTIDIKFTNEVLQELLTNVRKSTVDLKMNETLNTSSRTYDSFVEKLPENKFTDSSPVKELCKDLKKNVSTDLNSKGISTCENAHVFDNEIDKLSIAEISTVKLDSTLSKVDAKIKKQNLHPLNRQSTFVKSDSGISGAEDKFKMSCANTLSRKKYSQQPRQNSDYSNFISSKIIDSQNSSRRNSLPLMKSNFKNASVSNDKLNLSLCLPTKKLGSSQEKSKRISLPLMKNNSKKASVSNDKLNASLPLPTKKLGSSQEILKRSFQFKSSSHTSQANKIENTCNSSKLLDSNLQRSGNSMERKFNKSLKPQIKIPKSSMNKKPIDTKVPGPMKTNQTAESQTQRIDSLAISSRGKIPVGVIKPRHYIGPTKVVRENKENNLPVTKSSNFPTTSKQALSAASRQYLNNYASTSKEQESSNLSQTNTCLRRTLLRNSMKSRIKPPNTKGKTRD